MTNNSKTFSFRWYAISLFKLVSVNFAQFEFLQFPLNMSGN